MRRGEEEQTKLTLAPLMFQGVCQALHIILSLKPYNRGSSIIIPTLQVRKLRLREVE